MKYKHLLLKCITAFTLVFLYSVDGASQCVPRVGFFCCEILPNNGCGTFTSVTPYSPGEYFRTPVLPGASYSISTCGSGSGMDTQITGFQGSVTATSIFYNDDSGPICSPSVAASITYVPNFNDYMRVAVQQYNCLPGGTQSITVRLRQNNNLNITSSDADMCEGQVRNLTATPTAVTPVQPNSGNGGTFSGTGVSGTTFTAPFITAESTTFVITYTYGYCSTTENITVYNTPGTANAGVDQTICATSTSLTANGVAYGIGTWSLVSGVGNITSPNAPNSGVTGLFAGVPSTFRWTWSNGPCTVSMDDVVINVDQNPTTSNAGPDQTVCGTSATLAGNTPAVGTGAWSLVGGSGAITTPSSPNSGITGLGVGSNTFRWTISNGVCPSSTDDVVITGDQEPTTANAGPDHAICSSSTTLAANIPSIGTGAWSLIGGSGTFTSPSNPGTAVTSVGFGPNTYRWTITNGMCTPSTDDVVVTRDFDATPADAGPDQVVCATTAILAGNTPSVGSGNWTLLTGSGAITSPSSPTSGITGLGVGQNSFQWKITNGACFSTDTVVITGDGNPTAADAGPDQSIPVPVTGLNGNSPGTGTGIWNVVLGAGTFDDATSNTTLVSGMNYGVNRFSWTVTGSCVPGGDTDTVDIVYDCEAVLTLQGIYPSGTYQADSSLTMRGLVPSPNIVTARAGFEVTLLDTFEVGLGAEFDAIINPCGSFLIENDNARSGNTNKDKEDTPATNKSILKLDVKLE